jgi:hypothetical protein
LNGRFDTIIEFIYPILCRDYEDRPELDIYSESGMDDASDLAELSIDARRAAEREMANRDREREPFRLLYADDDYNDEGNFWI